MNPSARPRRPRLAYETRLTLLALASGFPGVLITLIIVWVENYPGKVQWTIAVFIVAFWLGFALAVRERLIRPLQTLSNLLAALQEGDYSIRARGSRRDDSLDEVYREVNTLSSTLQSQRLGALEATALLRTVMAEIEVAVFAFDSEQKLKLVNRAGERLLAQPAERLMAKSASELGLADCLSGESTRTLQMSFAGGTGPWEVHRSTFRERGAPHQLLVLSDL